MNENEKKVKYLAMISQTCVEVIELILYLQAENEKYKQALEECKKQFQFYVEHHTANGKTDRAKVNQDFVDLCAKALER